MRKSILALLVLGALIYGLIQLYPDKNQKVPPLKFLEIDTTALQQIDIRLPAGEELSLTRGARHWRLSNGQQTTNTVPTKVAELLVFLEALKIDSFLNIGDRRLKELGLSPAKATHWKLVDLNGQEQRFQLGQGSMDPASETVQLFLRLPKSGNVCSVYGPTALPVDLNFQALRSKVFSQYDPAQVGGVSWRHRGDTLLQQMLDTTAAAPSSDSLLEQLVRRWASLSGKQFNDRFNPVAAGEALVDQLELTFRDDQPPLRFDCYWDSSWVQPFVLHSSEQPDIFFRSDSLGGLYEALIQPLWDRQTLLDPGSTQK